MCSILRTPYRTSHHNKWKFGSSFRRMWVSRSSKLSVETLDGSDFTPDPQCPVDDLTI